MINFPDDVKSTPCQYRTRSVWDGVKQERVKITMPVKELKKVKDPETGKLFYVTS